HAERDRQVVVAALLRQVGRGEIDGDALGRQGEAGGDEGRADPLLRLSYRLVAEAHDVEDDVAARDMHLHVYGPGLDSLERHGRYARHHVRPLWAGPSGGTFAEHWRERKGKVHDVTAAVASPAPESTPPPLAWTIGRLAKPNALARAEGKFPTIAIAMARVRRPISWPEIAMARIRSMRYLMTLMPCPKAK